ncbi:hypothetical protein NKW84_15290 [Acetobacter senegalensis]|uniref:hypothetical protein n=1 Tax=Acetobacter senegalensis TaxID=446692 RepID=UPI0020A08EED|nr:hypothetical protein [Acetobacter senegalensis]MCP1197213.1 hypothetical protein [Acetobacter senegalensis]
MGRLRGAIAAEVFAADFAQETGLAGRRGVWGASVIGGLVTVNRERRPQIGPRGRFSAVRATMRALVSGETALKQAWPAQGEP